MTSEEQMLNGFTEMMRGFWNNQDLKVPDIETLKSKMTIEEAIEFGNMWLEMNEDCKDSSTYAFFQMAIKALEQESCEDAISRNGLLSKLDTCYKDKIRVAPDNMAEGFMQVEKLIKQEPSVAPQPKIGWWIYDKKIENWRCSECGETPKTMGYCGSANFMAEHFKYCNHCGTKMQEVEE